MSTDTTSTDAKIIACTAAIKAIVETLKKKDPSLAAAITAAFETNVRSMTVAQYDLAKAAKAYAAKSIF